MLWVLSVSGRTRVAENWRTTSEKANDSITGTSSVNWSYEKNRTPHWDRQETAFRQYRESRSNRGFFRAAVRQQIAGGPEVNTTNQKQRGSFPQFLIDGKLKLHLLWNGPEKDKLFGLEQGSRSGSNPDAPFANRSCPMHKNTFQRDTAVWILPKNLEEGGPHHRSKGQ